MSEETVQVYRARRTLGEGDRRAVTEGRLYAGIETGTVHYIVNDLGEEHSWPFPEDFAAYFEHVGELAGIPWRAQLEGYRRGLQRLAS